jgi:hypothetical protein
MHIYKIYLLISFLLFFDFVKGQNYHAINGSSYGGSLSVGNNPASIVNTPYAWDVTPFSVQVKHSTNAFTIKKYSLLSSSKNAEISIKNGAKKRFLFATQDVRLLNTRIRLNANAAIAFGVNIRNYIYALNSKANWQDTVSSLSDFMKINTGHLPLSGEFAGSTWGELYGTYAQTIIDDGRKILNAGITIKLNRSLAGGYVNGQGVNYLSVPSANGINYSVTNGSLQYGYSSNFDKIDSDNSAAENRNAFLQNVNTGVSVDVGVEYILLEEDDDDNEKNGNIYDTKIGISLMDIGSNRYRYGTRSRKAAAGQEGVTNSALENKFSNINSFDDFNDSLATVSNSIEAPAGDFVIYEPTRLVINVDKHVQQNFFINAEVSLPVISLASKNVLFIKDLNLLAITPRWETKSLGAYLPVLLNSKNQLWVGAAFKAGPVLFGVHNVSNLFSKNKTQSGGLYLAFTIRPGKKHEREPRYPRAKLTRKERRSLACPQF